MYSFDKSIPDRRLMVCIENSCSSSLDHNDIVKAGELHEKHYLADNSDLIKKPTLLRNLVRPLFCEHHRDQQLEATVLAWQDAQPCDDLFEMFELDIHPYNWGFRSKLCHGVCFEEPKDHTVCRSLRILNELAVGETSGQCSGNEERMRLIKELVALSHCGEHEGIDGITRISDDWNNRFTTRLKQLDSNPSTTAPPRFGTGGSWSNCGPSNAKNGSAEPGLTPTDHSSPQTQASDAKPSSSIGGMFGGLFGSQPSPSAGGLFGKQPSPSTGDLFGKQPSSLIDGSNGFGGSTPFGTKPSSSVGEFKGFGGYGDTDWSSCLTPRTPPSTATPIPPSKSPSRSPHVKEPTSKSKPATKRVSIADSLGRLPPVTKPVDAPRTHSSSDVRPSDKPDIEDRGKGIRATKSSPNLLLESGAVETRGGGPITSTPSTTSNRTQEDVIFTQANTPVTPRYIDVELLRHVAAKKGEDGRKLSSAVGDVYVLQNPDWPKHVKIGMTTKGEKRTQQIQKDCKFESLRRVVDIEGREFLNFMMVEKLCHKELKNWRKDLPCRSCKNKKGEPQIHTEWFEVDPETAIRVVQKWRRWMYQSPYDEDGYLTPWWREKAGHGVFRETPFSDDTHAKFDKAEETIDDLENRHKRWSRWLRAPTVRECTEFEFWRFFFDLRPKRRSLWNVAKEHLGPLLISLVMAGIICSPRQWALLALLLMLALR
ncbi:hypothetical protein MMC16_002074 [Acarospora aff. strigata]|nr:hypothetical protein [Acarospora aff. strigata]